MKTYFMTNVRNIDELVESVRIGVNKSIKKIPFKVINTISISDNEFNCFSNNLLNNYKFLYPYINQMYFENDGTLRCVIVKGKENSIKILCFNSGCTYPRFVGIYEDNIIDNL